MNQTHRGYIFGYTKEVPEVNQTHRGYIFGYTKVSEVTKRIEVHIWVYQPNA